MRANTFTLALIMLISQTLHTGPARANGWSSLSEPAGETPKAIGSYTAGCLAGAIQLPEDGDGYHLMRLSRHRYFGHPQLIDFIRALSRQFSATQHRSLLIGDLGQARGGPTPSGHHSHQTGLDVDIWFDQEMADRLLSLDEREQRTAKSMVGNNGMEVNNLWSSAQAEVLRLASGFPSVERIFVNAAIKKNLCRTQRDRAWLRKIRPWWGHDEHFHVRLHCPPGDPQCLNQEPIPPGDGCGADLDWWFSAEARQPAKPGPRFEPILPPTCEALLHAPPRHQQAARLLK